MRFFGRILASAALMVGLVVGYGTVEMSSAAAYHLEHCNFATKHTKRITGHPATTAYRGVADGAAAEWNRSRATTHVTVRGGGVDIVSYDHNYGNTSWDGETFYTCSSRHTVSSTVTANLNRYYADHYTHLEKTIVLTHEFGHALGLAHQTHTGCHAPPIMTPSALQPYHDCGRKYPQGDDIRGLSAIY